LPRLQNEKCTVKGPKRFENAQTRGVASGEQEGAVAPPWKLRLRVSRLTMYMVGQVSRLTMYMVGRVSLPLLARCYFMYYIMYISLPLWKIPDYASGRDKCTKRFKSDLIFDSGFEFCESEN